MTQTMKIQKTDASGVVVSGKHLDWSTLRRAAKQEDPALASVYADILRRAESAESHRRIAEDWKTYGYPLRTGYDNRYNGQIVSKAWEIRRKQYHGNNGPVDARVAYIVTYDRSDRSTRREESPEFTGDGAYGQAEGWVSARYAAWSDELGKEHTAVVWFRD